MSEDASQGLAITIKINEDQGLSIFALQTSGLVTPLFLLTPVIFSIAFRGATDASLHKTNCENPRY